MFSYIHEHRGVSYLDGAAAGAHGEDGEVTGGVELGQHEGAQQGGERAPGAHKLAYTQRG